MGSTGTKLALGIMSLCAISVPGCEEHTPVTPPPPTEIILVVKSRTDERSAGMIRAVEEEIKNDFRTVVRVVSQDVSSNTEGGRFAPSSSIAAVLLSCKPWPGINPTIKTASGLNVPVFLLGKLYGPQEKPYGWSPTLVFTTLNDTAANQAGKALFEQLQKRRLLEEKSTLIVLRVAGEGSVERLRAKGFARRVLLAPTKLRELESVFLGRGRSEATRRVGQLLASRDDLRAILCTTAEVALGAADAVVDAGKKGQVLIGGADLSAEMAQAIRTGRIEVGVDYRPSKMASRAARFALNFNRQYDLRRPGMPVLHSFEIVTADNVGTAPTTNEATADDPSTVPKG